MDKTNNTQTENETNNNNNKKIFVTYLEIGVFIYILILFLLGVGLLSALVDPPYCEDSKIANVKSEVSYLSENKTFSDKLNKIPKRPIPINKDLDRCEELNRPTGGILWESYRLPTNIIPIKYEIILRTPIFAAREYSGGIFIEFKVNQPTDTIILNAKYLAVYLPKLRDSNNVEIELKCDGLYLPLDYYVLKTKELLRSDSGKNIYTLELYYTGYLDVFNSGIFEIKYDYDDEEFDGYMYASHFEPVDARKGYPCFDEPQLKATYSIKIYHPKGTQALSNMPAISEEEVDGEIFTIFKETPKMPSYLIALTVFNKTDFVVREALSASNTPIRIWGRKNYLESGLGDDPLKMTVNLFNALELFFKAEVGQAIPPKIDLFAIPYYPQDAVPHAGLIIFRENKLLFSEKTVQEKIKQAIALEIAKQLSELWFGNYVTFSWWNELWLQESIGDYFKYKVVDRAYPDWRVYDQFITEELIKVLVEDSYPSSHPVIKDINTPIEIDQLFDDVETSKGAAVLRMMEYEIGDSDFIDGLKAYLKNSQDGIGNPQKLWESLDDIRKWPAKDFADRWLRQSNYPLVKVRIEKNSVDGKFYLNIAQEKFRSEYSIFAGQVLYPSPYNFTWYLPLKCTFGRNPKDPEPLDINFDVETKEFKAIIGDGNTQYAWVHCDQRFAGYYLLDYSVENWENLGLALKAKNEYLEPVDRANIIHNLFVNSFAGITSYEQLTDVLSYLRIETDYLPWKTVHKHVNDLVDVLEYRRSFYEVSQFFVTMLQEIESKDNLWQASGDHTEELKREILLELACRMQDQSCLRNATNLWPGVYQSILDASKPNIVPPHVKSVVYNYHFQNTYVTDEWKLTFAEYETLSDIQEREMLLEAMTYSRLPSLLLKFFESISKDLTKENDFFDSIRLLAKNTLGREIIWDYVRSKYIDILSLYGFENINIGQMLIDVTSTFSDEFLYFELISFIYSTQDEAQENARLRTIEIVSTNVVWIYNKEDEIVKAFGGGRKFTNLPDEYSFKNKLDSSNLKQRLLNAYQTKFVRA